MKKHFLKATVLLSASLLIGTLTGCEGYDDTAIRSDIELIKKDMSKMNSSLTELRSIVNALQQGKLVTEVTQTENGYVLKLNDGQTLTIKNGEKGADAPVIGVKEENGVYYWTVTSDGTTDYLYADASKTTKLKVTGDAPVITIDSEGYWIVNDVRITDATGHPVKAQGSDATAVISKVEETDVEVIFTLADGKTTISLPKMNNKFAFIISKETNEVIFKMNETKTFELTMKDIEKVNVMKQPVGWKINIQPSQKKVIVTSPQNVGSFSEGLLSLIALEKNGKTHFATINLVASINYLDKEGTFIVCEGNMTTVNGTITYYDKYGKEYKKIFENANTGKELGNVVQDMYIHNDRIYILTQNGNQMGGSGRFIVCDAQTMRLIYDDPLIIKTPEGKGTWPQHLIVVNDSVAYVQYSDNQMETTSGVCKLRLSDKSVTVLPTLEGTFGKFTVNGATKMRMIYSRGKIYTGCGQKVVIIDPKSNSVIRTIPFENRQVKDMVKGADSNLYVALSGSFEGDQNAWGAVKFTSAPQITVLDHEGNILKTNELKNIEFPVATWSPNIGICASFTQPYLFFRDSQDFNTFTAARYNYQTNQLDIHYIDKSSEYQNIYGYMGVHPGTNRLWVSTTKMYTDTELYIYDISSQPAKQISYLHYTTQNEASVAGVDYVYRFTNEYINK